MPNNTKSVNPGPGELPFGRTLFVTIYTENGGIGVEGSQAGAAMRSLENGEPIIIRNPDGTIDVIPSSSVIYATWNYVMSDALPPEDDNCKSGDEPEPEPKGIRITNGSGGKIHLYVVANNTSPGTYGDMTFLDWGDGSSFAYITLEAGETLTATGIPDGTEFAVTDETADNVLFEGTIPGSFAFEVEAGRFDITNLTDEQQPFTIAVGSDITGQYGDIEFINGVAVLTGQGCIGSWETLSATGLPDNVDVKVFWGAVPPPLFDSTTPIWQGKTPSAYTFAPLAISYTRDDPDSLTVTLSSIDPNVTFNGTYGDMTFTDNVATFTMNKNDFVYADGIMMGVAYEINGGSQRNGYVPNVVVISGGTA